MVKSHAAFLSYVHSDDDHDGGRISGLRARLEGEVRMHTGLPFRVFQDRNDLEWGQSWQGRINDSLDAVTFLIPVVTPSFFRSPACRSEFNIFHHREKALGTDRLILPIYYLDCEELEGGSADEMAKVLAERQWSDWRNMRFMDLRSPEVSEHLAQQAMMIRKSIKELKVVFSKDTTTDSLDLLIDKRKEAEAAAIIDNGTMREPPREAVKSISTTHSTEKSYSFNYKVFTSKYDEEIPAQELITAQEIVEYSSSVIRGAALLLDKEHQQIVNWERNVDTTAIVVQGVAVSIMVDNSGSMKGDKISNVASWSLLLVKSLERVGVKTELVGFTTRSWKGGRSREDWLQTGRPANPGRLADLRYIVYKNFEDSTVACPQTISAMLKEQLLKENIDGEAIEWSQSRLDKIDAEKKVTLIISDGAPVDDSTLAANSGSYLERHLRQVIDQLVHAGKAVLAVGVDHDVVAYYGRNGRVAKASEIGIAALELLRAYIPQKNNKRVRRRSTE